MSYSFRIDKNSEGKMEVVSQGGDVPDGSFSVSGHHQLDDHDEITISRHHPSGTVSVRAHGYAGRQADVSHHAAQHAEG